MRCLYCGKELALLKRLTGGAEFCSDAHRKLYQSEYNDLALSRLLQAKPVADPLPELKTAGASTPKPTNGSSEARTTRAASGSKAAPTTTQAPAAIITAQLPAGDPNTPLVAQVAISVAPAGSVPAIPPSESVEILPPPPEPMPEEIVRAMWGPIVEQPVAAAPEPIVIPATETEFDTSADIVMPSRDMQDLARDFGLDWANPVTWRPPADAVPGSRRPFQRSLETRDFNRHNGTPELPSHLNGAEPDQHSPESRLAKDAGSREIAAAQMVRPPAAAQPWTVGALRSQVSIGAELGAFGTLNFDLESAEPRVLDATVEEPRMQAPPPAMTPAPVAVLPEAAPVIAVEVPRTVAPAAAVTEPLPISLPAIAATPAEPALSLKAAPLTIEPQTPASTALPLRPAMVLGPRVAEATPTEPAPVETPKVVAPPAASTRVVRSSSGKKRNDVRVTPVAPVQPPAKPVKAASTPAPVPVSAPAVPETAVAQVPVTPGAPVMVVVTSGPGMNVQAASFSPDIEVVQPGAPLAAPTPQPTIAAQPEIDLHLPEIHLQEVQQGFWAKLPSPVKIGIAAALVLTITGFAYMALNSSTASATTTTKPVATAKGKPEMPPYKLGQQINSGGWIDDWAPADTLRRVTLLRGSQPFSDYRMQFSAQIQKKAIGWMFRGINPKNFYVVKLEKQSSGLEPVVALVRYAVIDGKNEGRTETVLPMKVRVDTTYKIRFDAVGPNFAVWVNGQQIDQWKDTRLGSGGLGLYSEGDEAAAVHGNVDVFSLVASK